ncbi:helix-turn-helix transcriptional regulator [Streptomyces candidus]|uniref:DNA-binding NarL/FixJ family response regulator n=1 Tax=Streptomyces candidus TaxID=67283 RepID=A0A7X0HEA5_9ACTN|nr:response regulator transcription factor [Streptomyces candidus]MBB6436029.1 DNA-binding NarL/FixJ family response regulator [Streptomyces candidus]GHH43408.1 hypothetical protein GCM10018773_29340 [Streptomyces candidus]
METRGAHSPEKRTQHADLHRHNLRDLLTAVGRLSETVQQLHSNLAHLLPHGAQLAERVPAPATAPDNRRDPSPVASETPESALSPQEIRVLQLTSRGFSNRQIARALTLSEQTVKNYMSTVFRKIGVQSRTEAAYYWTHRGGQTPNECS